MSAKRCDKPITITFYKNDVLSTIAKCILEIIPYYDDIILSDVSKVIMEMSNRIDNSEHFKYNGFGRPTLCMTEEDFKKWLWDSLFEIKEFRNLNLTYEERENGVDVDDENRFGITFTSMYDSRTEESWKKDFIDLDAVRQNIMYELKKHYKDEDCFLCDHDGQDSLECLTCTNNPKFGNHYSHTNRPFGRDIERWCAVGCTYSRAICCYDCDRKDTCEDRCCGSYFTEDKITCDAIVHRSDCNAKQ